jgi:demethylmenaquinone methyltransferase/2-methoxy-6-polyprenyl-1,4-benzoquinol methylase
MSKSDEVRSIFNSIHGQYDLLNRVMSLGLDESWRRRAVKVAGVQPGHTVADICCGTGKLSLALRRVVGAGGRVCGLDFSENMLSGARANLAGENERRARKLGLELIDNIEFSQGDAQNPPFLNDSFDAVLVGWGLRNLENVHRAVAEMRRIVRPGGMVVSLDMGQPQLPVYREVYWLAFSRLVPRLGAGLGGGKADEYRYLFESARGFYAPAALADLFRHEGLVGTGWENLMGGAIAIVYGQKSERYR